ncbi:cell division protein FtsQ/DivIB, partial [Marinomonas sp.]
FGLISQVLSSTSLRIEKLSLELRGAWNITFTNGVKVKLGREEILERLQRFIAVYKSDLSGRIDQISSIDARYPHGVAVAWKETK